MAAGGAIRLVSCFAWVGAGGEDGRGVDSSAGISNSRPKKDNRYKPNPIPRKTKRMAKMRSPLFMPGLLQTGPSY